MFHCDTGWNSDIGVSNIQKIIEGLNLDLVTEVVNWEEMKDLQRAFFLSQVSFVDVPQDLALFSSMYNFAAKMTLNTLLPEEIMQPSVFESQLSGHTFLQIRSMS